jgi:hypothetical protein
MVRVGYADYFDVRTVAAPSRLREVSEYYKSRGLAVENVMLPKAALDDHPHQLRSAALR